MSDHPAVSVRKAVTAMVQAASDAKQLSQKFSADQGYADWDLKLEDLDSLRLQERDKLRVDVVTHTTQQDHAAITRGGKVRYTVPIDIAIRRKLGADKQDDDTGEISVEAKDVLMQLVFEIASLFTLQRLAEFQAGVWDQEKGGTTIPVCPDKTHLREHRQFTAIIRIFFRVDV